MDMLEQRADGKYKIVEHYRIKGGQVTRNTKIREGVKDLMVEGKKYKCLASFTFPISRPDKENLNERTYTTTLWLEVIKKKMGEGSYGLMDHPKEEGSTKDRFCVWHNIRIVESKIEGTIVVADAYLFGAWGKEVLAGLEAGGEVGLSTVGWGEFEEDNKTIVAETFELDRVADFVLHPSYEVYGTLEDMKTEAESVQDIETEKIQESIDKPNKAKEEGSMKRKQTLEERDFRKKIKDAVNGVKTLSDLASRLSEYEEILTYFEDVDFDVTDVKEEVQALYDTELSYKESLVIKGSGYDDLHKNLEEITTKHDSLTEDFNALRETLDKTTAKKEVLQNMCDELKSFIEHLKETIVLTKGEINGMYSADQYHELYVYTEAREKELATVQANLVSALATVDALNEEKKTREDAKRAEETRIKEENHLKRQKSLEDFKERRIKEAEEKKRLKEETMSFSNTSAVETFYNEKVASNPELDFSKFKDSILSCKTVLEAELKFMRVKAMIDSSDAGNEYLRELNGQNRIKRSRDLFENQSIDEDTEDDTVYKGYDTWI